MQMKPFVLQIHKALMTINPPLELEQTKTLPTAWYNA